MPETASKTTRQGSDTLAERLADKICSFKAADMTSKSIALSRMAIIDTIAVSLAGIPEPCCQILMQTPGVADAPGPCLIFGTDRRTSALDAALVNGVAAHALDYDDVNQAQSGHHSAPLVAPLFALAEMRHATGQQMMAAYIIGVETEIRLARTMNAANFHHYDKGWHATATMGVFGVAAAASHMLGLDRVRTAKALALAASFASGIKSNFGTMTKPMHVGQCARNGLFAAFAAERGFESNPGALEHKQGFLNVYNGPGLYDPERMFENWGAPWEIESDDNGLKQFACCGSTHPAISMMLKLVKEEGIKAEQAKSIEILAHRRRLPHTNNPWPNSPLEAKFSIQYATARALVDGAVRIADFEGEAYADPRVTKLLHLTKAGPHPDMPDDSPNQFGAEVIVTTHDGRRLSRRVEQMVCRGGANAMSTEEMWEKFEDCGHRALPADMLAPLFERLETLETADDMAKVTALLEPRRTPAAAVAHASALARAGGAKPTMTPASAVKAGPASTSWVP
jgi:2-methylcitrate dehydratase PrpD